MECVRILHVLTMIARNGLNNDGVQSVMGNYRLQGVQGLAVLAIQFRQTHNQLLLDDLLEIKPRVQRNTLNNVTPIGN